MAVMQRTGNSISAKGPRDVRPSETMILSKVGIPVVYAILTVICWCVSADRVSKLDSLRLHGIVTEAKIDDKHTTSGKSTTYYIEYSYADQTDKDSVDRDLYDGVEVGGSTTVTYLEADPTLHVLGIVDQDRVDRLRGFWEIALLVLTGVSAMSYGTLLATYGKQLVLLRDGRVVQATVESTEAVVIGRATYRRVRFIFQSEEGFAHTSSLDLGVSDDFARKAGDRVWYAYPEKGPLAGRLIPQLSLVRLGEPGEV